MEKIRDSGDNGLEQKKKKYKKIEVESMLSAISNKYEQQLVEQKNKIRELIKENNDLKTSIESYKDKEELILLTLMRAEATANDIKKDAELQYSLELQRIKNFSKKWNGYFKELKEKYPLYPVVKKALNVVNKLEDLSGDDVTAKATINELDEMIDDGVKKFNPKSKIKDYIVATKDGGFDMNEVLNPGALKLEDLCKELGLIEESE